MFATTRGAHTHGTPRARRPSRWQARLSAGEQKMSRSWEQLPSGDKTAASTNLKIWPQSAPGFVTFLVHLLPSGNWMPSPTHFPSRFLGPPFGEKSIMMLSPATVACTAQVTSLTPYLHLDPRSASLPLTLQDPCSEPTPTYRLHPGCSGSS